MFLVQVAADIFGSKLNFELSFASRPTLQELSRATETAFSNEIALRRPAGVPSHQFRVNKIKVYAEEQNRWADLRAETQLFDSCQCYAFQVENAWHRETQKEIPPAVRPPTSSAAPMSNPNNSSAVVPRGGYGDQPSSYGGQPSSYGGQPSSAYGGNNSASQPPYRASTGPRSTTGGPVTPVNAGTVPAGFTAVDATQDEKIRAVFAEFDVKQQRMLDQEDLVHGFRSLGFEMTSNTVKDLFLKGDQNHDGRISYSEFETFARWYPIMMDCLFYRSRAFWEDKNMERQIEKEKEAVRQAEALVAQAEQAHRQAKQDEEDAQNGIMDAEADMRDKAQRARELQAAQDAAERDREKAARDKADREHDALSARDAERQARGAQGDLGREAEKQDRRLADAAAIAQKADQKVKELEAALAEAKRQADRAHQTERQAANDAEAAREKERAAAKNADAIAREIPKKDDALKQAEANLAAMDDRVRELGMMARDNQRDQDEAARRRDAADRQVQGAGDNVARMADEVEKAKRAADERARNAAAREQELLDQQEARRRVSAEEQALVDQEIKLREQRESLESKESKLQSEATNFLGKVRANNASRAPSHRDPSYSRAM